MKAVKIIVAVLATVTALLVIAAAVVATLFDPNDYKGVATDAFTARTGRSLIVEQDLKLSFFPWLAVETGGVTIGDAAGFETAETRRRPGICARPCRSRRWSARPCA